LISLYDLALARQAAGDLDDAADLLKQGLSLAAEAGDQPGLAYYLEALAAVAAQQDHPERAISLLAAAAALLEAKGSGWLHAYVPRAPHGESVLAGLRARTTDAAFERAQAYGRTLTSTSVVRYALQETPRRAEPSAALASGTSFGHRTRASRYGPGRPRARPGRGRARLGRVGSARRTGSG